MTNDQIAVLLTEATRAGDAGIAETCRRALATGEPWTVAAAQQRCARIAADIVRHDGLVRTGEWNVSADALLALRSTEVAS